MQQLQRPLKSVLEDVLLSHRDLLSLNLDNADALFNTAQVLTSLAEEVDRSDQQPEEIAALQYLYEAWQLLQRCFSLQERDYAATQQKFDGAHLVDEDSMISTSYSSAKPQQEHEQEQEQEQWVSVVEPTNKEVLVDTAIAQLSTLTALCGILASSDLEDTGHVSLGWVENQSINLQAQTILTLARDTERADEALVARASLNSALLEAAWRKRQIDLDTYQRESDAALAKLAESNAYASAMSSVTSLLALNDGLSETNDLSIDMTRLASLRWQALAKAIAQLTRAAAKLPTGNFDELPHTHRIRGDASLRQYQLSKPPLCYSLAVKHAGSLLKNAEIFYRNASRIFTHGNETERRKSSIRETVVRALQGIVSPGQDGTLLKRLATEFGKKHVDYVVKEMVEEGSLDKEDLQMLEAGT